VVIELTAEQDAELRALSNSRDVPAALATRARIVRWSARGNTRKDIGPLRGVAADRGPLAGLVERKRGGPHVQVSPQIRARIVALTRTTSSAKTGLSHWSCCELAAYLKRAEGVTVSWSYVAKI